MRATFVSLCPDLENSCRDDQPSKKEPNRLESDRERGLESPKTPYVSRGFPDAAGGQRFAPHAEPAAGRRAARVAGLGPVGQTVLLGPGGGAVRRRVVGAAVYRGGGDDALADADERRRRDDVAAGVRPQIPERLVEVELADAPEERLARAALRHRRGRVELREEREPRLEFRRVRARRRLDGDADEREGLRPRRRPERRGAERAALPAGPRLGGTQVVFWPLWGPLSSSNRLKLSQSHYFCTRESPCISQDPETTEAC